MAERSIAHGCAGLALVATLAGLSGCDTITSVLTPDHLDYKSAGKVTTKSLEVPPDLTQLKKDNRYAVPEAAAAGSATASGMKLQPAGAAPVAVASNAVALKSIGDMHIERNGNQRYLVVKQSPEALWPEIKDFWQESGFLINIDEQKAGVMETDWAENRAKIPQDIIRRTIGRVLDSFYSTSERDKFRTRLERGPDGTTEIYISHRGAQEELTGAEKEKTVWTARPADPELEAEFLVRLMTRLGSEPAQAKAVVAAAATAAPTTQRAKLVKAADGTYVEVDEEFERAWRRVGLALDRVGFTVEDRDRTLGLYFVRYVDDVANKVEERGFFSRLFHYDGGDQTKAAKYRISVKGSANSSRILVLGDDGKVDNTETAGKILALLNEQLK